MPCAGRQSCDSLQDPALDAGTAADLASPGALPSDMDIIFVLGGPGSGKGTQCARIVGK
jgi:hypothetical protein